jgi:hypothetical protein
MLLLPHRRCTLTAAVGAAEFATRLASITSPSQPWFRSLVGQYEFVGTVSPEGFRLTPVTRGRNTYLPRVTGVFSTHGDHTEVQITQALHPVAIAILLAFGAPIVISLIIGNFSEAFTLLALFAAFHLIMYFVGFLPEARRVEHRLIQLADLPASASRNTFMTPSPK